MQNTPNIENTEINISVFSLYNFTGNNPQAAYILVSLKVINVSKINFEKRKNVFFICG